MLFRSLVEVTGGEPLLQEDVYPLMEGLLGRGFTVMIETGGHRSIARVPSSVIKIVDIKCPGSGEASANDWDNIGRLAPHDEVKFVIADRIDYEFARETMRTHRLAALAAEVGRGNILARARTAPGRIRRMGCWVRPGGVSRCEPEFFPTAHPGECRDER